jgi:hypothetical protein
MPRNQIIKLSDWLIQTDLHVGPIKKRRSSKLSEVDLAIKNYEKSKNIGFTTPNPLNRFPIYSEKLSTQREYTRKWLITEIKLALDSWKLKKGPRWHEDERNMNGHITELGNLLADLMPQPAIVHPDDTSETFSDNARLGILHFLSNSRTMGMTLNPVALLTDAAFVGTDVQHLVSIGNKGTANEIIKGITTNDTSSESFAKMANNVGVLNDLYNAVVEWLKKMIAEQNLVGKIAEGIGELIIQMPQLIGAVFASILSELGNVVGIGKNIYNAISSYGTYRHRAELENGIMSGHPKKIIESVYEQIKQSIKDSGKEALLSGLKMGVNVASAGAGVVVNAIANFFSFIYKLFVRIKDTIKFRKVIEEAAIKDDKYTNADAFQTWFQGVITQLPIISSYCLTMPMTGSFYGFLAATSTNNSSFSFNQLERNNNMFNDVKKRAFSYIGNSDLKVTSTDKMVQQSLTIAQGGGVNLGSTESKSTSIAILKGIMSNLGYTAAENTGTNLRYGWGF